MPEHDCAVARSRTVRVPALRALWFHKKWRPNVPDGEAIIVRYADDIVVGFQHKRDAERYLRDVRERLARFGLRLHPDKTRLVEFGRFAVMNRRQRGVASRRLSTSWDSRHFRLGRKPVAKRVNRTLARIDEVLRKRWHHDIWEVGRWLGRVCEGWLNYFAVPRSGRFIRAFHRRLQRLWMRALRRRSQRDRFTVIEIASGVNHGTWDRWEDVAICLAFAKLSRDLRV